MKTLGCPGGFDLLKLHPISARCFKEQGATLLLALFQSMWDQSVALCWAEGWGTTDPSVPCPPPPCAAGPRQPPPALSWPAVPQGCTRRSRPRPLAGPGPQHCSHPWQVQRPGLPSRSHVPFPEKPRPHPVTPRSGECRGALWASHPPPPVPSDSSGT